MRVEILLKNGKCSWLILRGEEVNGTEYPRDVNCFPVAGLVIGHATDENVLALPNRSTIEHENWGEFFKILHSCPLFPKYLDKLLHLEDLIVVR